MSEMVNEGVSLMFVGMGIVFLFLALLIFLVRVMSALVLRFPTEAEIAPVTARTVTGAVQGGELMAVISAAIHRYRSR